MEWLRRLLRIRDLPAEPTPPVDVKIRLLDGRLIPVDTMYLGIDRGPDGRPIHQWGVTLTGIHPAMVETISVRLLPPHTGVTLQVHE